MKHIIHTPTEQYGFVETEFDEHDKASFGTRIIEGHKEIVALAKPQEGLDNKTFIGLLDELWEKESIQNDPGITEQMSHSQSEILRAFKLVIQRAKDKQK